MLSSNAALGLGLPEAPFGGICDFDYVCKASIEAEPTPLTTKFMSAFQMRDID